ncbi:MAG: PKD domain-containing protein [Pseudomonadota bacterium]
MRRKHKKPGIICEELEQRLLFSAGGFDVGYAPSAELTGQNVERVLNNRELESIGVSQIEQPVKQALTVVVNNDETLVNPTSPNEEVTSGLNRGGANAIAMDAAGNTVVVWSDSARDGSGWGVYAQRFDANGDKVGAEIQVNNTTSGDQRYASVAMDDSGRFVVAFSSADASGNGIYLRRFAADGTAIDSADVLVNAGNTNGNQANATVALNASGQMAVAWQSNGSTPGVHARHFDMTSTAPGDQLPTDLITVESSSAADEPSVDINTSGRMVVVWEQSGDLFGRRYDHGNSTALSGRHDLNLAGFSEGSMTVAVQDTGEFAIAYRSDVFLFNGIWVRHFAANGSDQGASTRVSSSGQNPSIATGIDDSFIVVYEDSDASGNGVFAQKFDPNRVKVGSVFQVNSSTNLDQDSASIAVHDIDNFAVVWSGNGTQAGNIDANGVFKRQFGTATANTAPNATNLNAAETFIEDTPLNLADIVVSDTDNANTTVTLTLSDTSAGSLSIGTSGSVTSTFNSGTGVWNASGAINDVNTLLANLIFTPSLNYDSDFGINTSVSDGIASPVNGVKSMTALADDDAWHLMLATFDVSSPSGAPGLDSWTDSTFLRFSDPGFTLGEGSTNGTFSGVFDLEDFSSSSSRLHAIHYVGRDLSLGGASSPTIDVKAGDVLFATQSDETLTSVNSISIESKDVVLFSPTVAGDYSAGTFTIVLDEVDGSNLHAITLVERDTTLADGTVLNEGDFLFATGSKELGWFVTDDVGAGTTTGTTRVLLDGDDTNVDLSSDLRGIDLVEAGTTLGGVTLNSGDILVSTKDSIAGGQNSLAFTNNDVVRLDIGQTTWFAGNGNGSATVDILFHGDNVGLDSNSERVHALSMVPSVGASNNAPLATNLSAAEAYTEDVTLNLTDIVVTDTDNTNTTVTLTLSDLASGNLSTATSGSVTSAFNAATGVWQASGAIADVNTLLQGVSFTPGLNYDSDFSIGTSVDDGIAAPITGIKLFTATPVNDAPTATNLSAAEAYTEDTALNLSDIVVTDTDNANTTVTLTLSDPAAGSLDTATSGSVTSSFNAGTGVWQASGAIADVNTLLQDVSFTPGLNYDSDFSIGTSVDDGIAAPITGTKPFTATPVNDAPTATNLSAPESYLEDNPLNLANINVMDVDDAATRVVLRLSDPSAGSLSIGNSGTVTSTYNAGTGTWVASGAVSDVNALLASVVFTPSNNYSLDFNIQTSVDDSTNPPITGAKLFTATASNDAPIVINENTPESYIEDTLLNLVDIVVSDSDSANVTVVLTLSDSSAGTLSTATSGAVSSSFDSVNGIWTASGVIADVNALLAGVELSPTLNYNSSFNISVSVSDGVAPAVLGTKAITGSAVNDEPIAQVAPPAAIFEGDALALDASGSSDIDGSIQRYDWDIGADGSIEVSSATPSINLTWETLNTFGLVDDGSYQVSLRATDDLDATDTQTFAVSVNNTAPTIALSGDSSVTEGDAYELTVNAIDPGDDLLGNLLIDWGDGTTDSIIGGVGTYSHEYSIEAANRTIEVIASDEDGSYPAVQLSISVTANNQPSGEITIDSGAEVSVGDTLSFSSTLSDADGISGSINYQWQRDGNDIPGANGNSYVLTEADAGASISIVATYVDGLGNPESVSSTTTVSVLSNQAPSISLSDESISLLENLDTSMRIALSDITVMDDNLGDNTLLLSGPNAELFEIDSGILYLKAGVALDYESVVRLEVTVSVDDETVGSGIDDSKVFAVNVQDVDEAEPEPEPKPKPEPEPEPQVIPPPPPAQDDTQSPASSVPNNTDVAAETTEPVNAVSAENTAPEPLERLPGAGGGSSFVEEPVRVATINGIDGVPVDQITRSAFVERNGAAQNQATINVALLEQLSALDLDNPQLRTTQLILDEPEFADPMADFSILDNGGFVKNLDNVRLQLQANHNSDQIVIGSTIVTTTSLSVGYVIWLIRGSVLLSSLLTSVPAWRIIDPLPVLAGALQDDDEDDESLQSILEEQEETEELSDDDSDPKDYSRRD